MKEISIFIPTEDLAQVAEILRKHDVGGISLYEINGAGRTKRDAVGENSTVIYDGKNNYTRLCEENKG
jgi:nitrogen regulatory protein PII